MLFHTQIPFRFWVYLALVALAAYNFDVAGLVVATVLFALLLS